MLQLPDDSMCKVCGARTHPGNQTIWQGYILPHEIDAALPFFGSYNVNIFRVNDEALNAEFFGNFLKSFIMVGITPPFLCKYPYLHLKSRQQFFLHLSRYLIPM